MAIDSTLRIADFDQGLQEPIRRRAARNGAGDEFWGPDQTSPWYRPGDRAQSWRERSRYVDGPVTDRPAGSADAPARPTAQLSSYRVARSTKPGKWSGRRGSNPRHAAWKAGKAMR